MEEKSMKQAVIIQPLIENNRIQLGISYIERALKDVGYEISGVTEEPGLPGTGRH